MALGCIPRFSPSFSPREFSAALRAMALPGDESQAVAEFEEVFAEYIGARHAIMVPSARFGFWTLLDGWGIGAGDEVVIPAMTYFAIPGMAHASGATPVFADIDATSYTLDPEAFEAAITPRTKAVVPTHLFGNPADMEPIRAIAKKHGIKVIEDCAQATGATYWNGKRYQRVGGFGDAAYYTFGLTKNITTLKGAMVTTDDDDLADRVRAHATSGSRVSRKELLREALTGAAMMVATHPAVYPFTVHPAVVLGNRFGADPIHDRFGEAEYLAEGVSEHYFDSAPRAAQAAVGAIQLERIDQLNGARVLNGRFLDEHLAHIAGLTRMTWPKQAEPIFMSYVVQHDDREALANSLRRRGVDTTVGYMTDASSNPLFADYAKVCPNARRAYERLLHLPVHPNLGRRDLHHLVESVRLACLEIDR